MSAKRRKQNNKSASNPPSAERPQTADAKPPRPIISQRRKWLFRLAAMIIPLVLFFALLEAGLRLGGYGYPTGFFVGPNADGNYVPNYRFGWRFFPRSLARQPRWCFLSAKPAGAVRIFVLGSSAAMGTPDSSFGFGRILEVMLRERYPETRFEVVNAAMTAINSHVALEIARDCADFQPDLYVVYMGNNEIVGPYGPGTVFQQWSPSLRFIRTSIWVKATRIGQLIGDIVGYVHSKGIPPAQWRGMEMFLGNQVAADDPRLATLYENFRRNLIDICEVARRAGAGVILSTVATNLRDCAPLASLHRSGLAPDELTKWESIYKAGIELEADKQWPEAIAKYEEAARIDDRFADLQFRLGRCLAAADRFAEARDRFISARDLDTLRFRADSHINAVIREAAAEKKASGVRLVDAEQALAHSELAPDGILGGDMFYEHVHLTFAGNYLLARAVLEQIGEALPKTVRLSKTGSIPSRQQCAEALVFTPCDEYQMAEDIADTMSNPPFTNQLDHAVRRAQTQERLKRLFKVATSPEPLQATWKAYEAALRDSPDDWDLNYRFAKVAKRADRPDVAAEHMQIVVKKLPWSMDMQYSLGVVLELCGEKDEAVVHYQKALELAPYNAIAHYNLGRTFFNLRKVEDSIAQFQKALELKPDYAEAHCDLGVVLVSCNRLDEAVAHYRKALALRPDYAEAHGNLGVVLAGTGKIAEAIAQLQKAVDLNPNYVQAHNILGEVLVRVGRVQEAIPLFEQALKIQPDNAMIKRNLNNARAAHPNEKPALPAKPPNP
jgi:tetratricopeptide (TPR) repeat protein